MQDLLKIVNEPLSSSEVANIIQALELDIENEEPLEEGVPAEKYLVSRSNGVQIRIDSRKRIGVIFLYGEKRDGFEQYRGPLIASLSFSSKRNDVEYAFGKPSASAEPGHTVLGRHGGWVRYDGAGYSLHFSFSVQDSRINLITIMNSESVPA